MRLLTTAAAVTCLTLGTMQAGLVLADGGECRLGDQTYPPDVLVCSNGLAVTCQNGSWQNNDGRRCDEPTGTYLGARRPLQEKNDEPIPDYVKEKYPELDLQ